MNAKKIKKQIEDNSELRHNLVNLPYGSLVQTYLILTGTEWDDALFVNKFKKGKFPFMGDEEFIEKTLLAVGLDADNLIGKPVMLCEGTHNMLFCPYIVDTTNGEILPLPLFKDAPLTFTQTQAMDKGDFKIIDWTDFEFHNKKEEEEV